MNSADASKALCFVSSKGVVTTAGDKVRVLSVLGYYKGFLRS